MRTEQHLLPRAGAAHGGAQHLAGEEDRVGHGQQQPQDLARERPVLFFFAISSLIVLGSMLAKMANSAKMGISLSACLMGFWLPSFFKIWLP